MGDLPLFSSSVYVLYRPWLGFLGVSLGCASYPWKMPQIRRAPPWAVWWAMGLRAPTLQRCRDSYALRRAKCLHRVAGRRGEVGGERLVSAWPCSPPNKAGARSQLPPLCICRHWVLAACTGYSRRNVSAPQSSGLRVSAGASAGRMRAVAASGACLLPGDGGCWTMTAMPLCCLPSRFPCPVLTHPLLRACAVTGLLACFRVLCPSRFVPSLFAYTHPPSDVSR